MEIIAIGSRALMHGFSLLGITTYADQTPDVINNMLIDLQRTHERALVFIQQDILQANIPMIDKLHNKGGSILVCVVPNLQQADQYQPAVEALISRVMGASVLEQNDGK